MNEKQQNQYNIMTTLPVEGLLLNLSIPTIISMMVTNIYNIVDTAFVGTLGTSESGATGVVFGFMAILQAFGFLCGQGAGSIMARKLGEKNLEEATKFTNGGFALSFSSGLVIAILGFIFLNPLLTILGSTTTIAPFAKTYISCMLVVAPFFTSSYTMNNLLRYEGKAKLGTVGMMTGAVLNIAFDAILIFIFKLGILGAGIATAVAQTISFGILFSMFFVDKTQTKLSIKKLPWDLGTYISIVTTGFPSLLRQSLNSIATIMLNRQAGLYGDAAVSAMSIVSRISFFPMAVAIGIGQGFQPISSFNFGANKKRRVRDAFWKATIASEIAVFFISLPIFIFAGFFVMRLRNDPQVITYGIRALRLACLGGLLVPLTMMTEMGFQSTGARLLASISSSLRSGIVFVPTLLFMSTYRKFAGIQEAQPLSIAVTFIISVYMTKLFMKRVADEKEK